MKPLQISQQLKIAFLIVLIIPFTLATSYSINYFSEKIMEEASATISLDAKLAKSIYEKELQNLADFARSLTEKRSLRMYTKLGLESRLNDHMKSVLPTVGKYLISLRSKVLTEEDKLEKYLCQTALKGKVVSAIESISIQKAEQLKNTFGNFEQKLFYQQVKSPLLNFVASAPLYSANGTEIVSIFLIRKILNEDQALIEAIENELQVSVKIYNTAGWLITARKTTPHLMPEKLNESILREMKTTLQPYQEALIQKNGYLSHYLPLFGTNGSLVGILQVQADVEKYVANRNTAILHIFLIAIFGCIFALSIGIYISQRITQRIEILSKGAETIASGNYTFELQIKSQDELGQLAERFNQMSKHLQESFSTIERQKESFKRFVPQQFLSHIAKEGLEYIHLGQAHSANATILFSDIRSFTSLAETLNPQELLNFLNSYFRRMNKSIHKYDGFIDKFIGDAIMALFHFPQTERTFEVESAVWAAIEMQRSIQLYNTHRKSMGYSPIEAGIGIHRGPIVIGTVGSEERMESTALGDAVNIASRLEGLTKFYQCSIIVSSEIYRELPIEKNILWRELDFVRVRGRKKPLTIFEIFNSDTESIQEKKQHILGAFHEGLLNFYNRQWQEAISFFEACLQIYPQDRVSRMYIERSMNFLQESPSAEWDGSRMIR